MQNLDISFIKTKLMDIPSIKQSAKLKAVILGILLALIIANPAYAQDANILTGTGVAISIPVIDKDVQNGDVLASTEKGYTLSTYAYQPSIYGVITTTPALFLHNGDTNLKNTQPVLISGKAFVRVSTINGAIRKNDFLTSSEIRGVAGKSTANGFVLGTALEDYSSNNPKSVGKILVYINPHFNATFIATNTNLLESLKNIIASPTLAPLTTFRYLLAALVAIASFILGFIHFGRIVKTGIESLGRNPLAGVFIQISVLMNVVLTIGIVLGGLGIGYLILAL